MQHDPRTHEIIGAAHKLHRLLGPGLLESASEECPAHELSIQKLEFRRQVPVPVVDKGVKLECGYRIDILLVGTVVLELKSIEAIAPVQEATLLTCLRPSGNTLGLLTNFNMPILKEGIRGFVLKQRETQQELR